MKTFILFAAIIGTLVGVGLYQNYENSTAMCEEYHASEDFTGYECPDGKTYYKEN